MLQKMFGYETRHFPNITRLPHFAPYRYPFHAGVLRTLLLAMSQAAEAASLHSSQFRSSNK